MLSGDVAIFRDTGLLEAHIIAHEFSHRKGYWKELYAQVLGYLALVTSGEPVLRQSARLERLHRNLRVLAGDDRGAFDRLVTRAPLRPELRALLMKLRAPLTRVERQVEGRDAPALPPAHARDRADRDLRLRPRLHELPLHLRDQHHRQADPAGGGAS